MRVPVLVTLLPLATLLLAGCESSAPMERTGRALDRAGTRTGQAVGGAAEDTGQAINRAGQWIERKVEPSTPPR